MSEPKTTVENELNAARDVLLAATRQAFPKLEPRISENPTAQQHPEFDAIVRVLKTWYAGMRRRADAGERPNHAEGDIHTRIFNTGELVLYAARDAQIPDFKTGGAAILAEHVTHFTQKEREKIGKNAALTHMAEESIAEMELVAEMYASLLGISNEYSQTKLKIERSGGMTP